ncbi:MAG: hypothetical protein MH321_11055 [Leptospiraceae bacterium]|nr:hypothetical protein [Leptospiraceae bacterium]
MKKLLLTISLVFLSFVISDCRSFNDYTTDGSGGIYRKGVKIYFFIFGNYNYVEHCKKENDQLNCVALDERL